MRAEQKFDAIVEQVFGMQLTGRGKTPEERVKILRKLSGHQRTAQKERKGKEDARKARRSSAVAVAAAQANVKADSGKAGAGHAHKNHPVMLKQAAKHKAAREQAKHDAAGKKSQRPKIRNRRGSPHL